MNCRDVCFELGGECAWRVVFCVSHSKTDQESRGVKLRFKCTCTPTSSATSLVATVKSGLPLPRSSWDCVVCSCMAYAINMHNSLGPWPDDVAVPFFRTVTGARISAKVIAATLQLMDRVGNINDREDLPSRGMNTLPPAWGGHSLRRSGARHYFRLGLSKE